MENIENLLFVTATKGSGTELLLNKPLGLFLEKSKMDKQTDIVENNKTGLTKVYNKYLTEEYRDKYIIFVHDDVIIDDLFFEEKIINGFSDYDIIGLAGSKKCDLTASVPAWHMMSQREDFVGEVAHRKDDVIWTTCFGPTKSRALVIDGLFIGVNVNRALEVGLKFDENFDFHHYDITFCLMANKLKLKMGVIPLRAIHFGLGDSMNTPEWAKSAETFKKLYKDFE